MVVRTLLLLLLSSGFAYCSSLSLVMDTCILYAPPDTSINLASCARWAWHPYKKQRQEWTAPESLIWMTTDSAIASAPRWDIGYRSGLTAAIRLRNEGADTLRLYYHAFEYRYISLWHIEKEGVRMEGQGGHFANNRMGQTHSKYWLPIVVPPGEEKVYVFVINVWLPMSNLELRFFSEAGMNIGNSQLDIGRQSVFLFFIVTYSLLAFLVIAGSMQWLTSGDRSYLYYAAFAGCNLLYLLIITDPITEIYNPVSNWASSIRMYGVAILMCSYLAYFRFSSHFLSVFHPSNSRLQKVLRFSFAVTSVLLAIVLAVNSLFNYDPVVLKIIYSSLLLMMPLALWGMYVMWRTRERLARILTFGMFLYLMCSALGYCFSLGIFSRIDTSAPWSNPYFFTGLGALVESSFFFFALGYRLKLLYIENTRLIRDSYSDKERIARDLHDEIGSILSSISILSQSASYQLQNETAQERLGVIGARSRQVLDVMSDIVWSVNPINDSMEKLWQHMKEFAIEIFEPLGVTLYFSVGDWTESAQLPTSLRKDFYLLFKEAVNNVAKYSHAREVWVTVLVENGSLTLEVRDNGCGFDPATVKQGNGLWNMQRRAERMGGTLRIESAANAGTRVSFEMK